MVKIIWIYDGAFTHYEKSVYINGIIFRLNTIGSFDVFAIDKNEPRIYWICVIVAFRII